MCQQRCSYREDHNDYPSFYNQLPPKCVNAPMTYNSYIEKSENMTCVGLEFCFCRAVVKLDMPNA